MTSTQRFFIFALLTAAGAATAEPTATAPDAGESPGLQIMRAIEAAKDQPFLEPEGDLKAMLLNQNPELAAPDCGVRYKPLSQHNGIVTLLIAAQGRCRNIPGMPPQWVLQIGAEAKRP